jgi:hypothetical protein
MAGLVNMFLSTGKAVSAEGILFDCPSKLQLRCFHNIFRTLATVQLIAFSACHEMVREPVIIIATRSCKEVESLRGHILYSLHVSSLNQFSLAEMHGSEEGVAEQL